MRPVVRVRGQPLGGEAGVKECRPDRRLLGRRPLRQLVQRVRRPTGAAGRRAQQGEAGDPLGERDGVLLGDQADLGGYVRRTLGPVLDYDTARSTDLVTTLDAYFAQGASLTRTRPLRSTSLYPLDNAKATLLLERSQSDCPQRKSFACYSPDNLVVLQKLLEGSQYSSLPRLLYRNSKNFRHEFCLT